MVVINRTIARRLIQEVFNEQNLDAIEELVARDFVGLGSGGPEGFRKVTAVWLDAFPDLQVTMEHVIAEGDWVVTRTMNRGTHTGEFASSPFGAIPATGSRIAVTETEWLRFAEGKIVEWRSDWDALGFYQQLGVIGLPA